MSEELPLYEELPVTPDAPAGSSWGVWGDRDLFGTLNLQTSERARRAAASIRTGRWFPLDLELQQPDPPLFGRPALTHEVSGPIGANHDDILRFNTQSSTQWDGFRHFAHRVHGHYGGVPDEEHGIDHWGNRGIVGRCVLVDVDRWRTAEGRPIAQGTPDPILVADLEACIRDQGTPVEVGDVLLVRTGWMTWYRSLDRPEREAYAAQRPLPCPGPTGSDLPAFLWNLHISAVAADNPSFEMFPSQPDLGFLHPEALALLGIPLGELWDLDALAEDCAAAATYDAFLTSSPLRVRGGVGSPPNAIAIR